MDGGQSERVRFRAGEMPARPAGDRLKPDTPEILSQLWARDAADGLASRTPAYSARAGLTQGQGASVNLALALVILLVARHVPIDASLLAALGAIPFSCLIGLRLAACLIPPAWATRRELPANALPRASVIVALYRESAVLPVLAAALEAIDYPADRLEIRLALEADDRETIAAARALDLDGKYRIILVPEGGPRTKPRALNYALRFCSGEIITIHDAEDRPHPRQLRTAAECFAAAGPELACLQAPLNWFNRSECWLTRQFALEYAAHFHALLPLYARLRWPLPLGGTSNHFRGLMYQAHQTKWLKTWH
jgi:cellulose synthase/poly-beta-1,6-N-acetylglucosamine synthase-like glycosyltransferase